MGPETNLQITKFPCPWGWTFKYIWQKSRGRFISLLNLHKQNKNHQQLTNIITEENYKCLEKEKEKEKEKQTGKDAWICWYKGFKTNILYNIYMHWFVLKLLLSWKYRERTIIQSISSQGRACRTSTSWWIWNLKRIRNCSILLRKPSRVWNFTSRICSLLRNRFLPMTQTVPPEPPPVIFAPVKVPLSDFDKLLCCTCCTNSTNLSVPSDPSPQLL